MLSAVTVRMVTTSRVRSARPDALTPGSAKIVQRRGVVECGCPSWGRGQVPAALGATPGNGAESLPENARARLLRLKRALVALVGVGRGGSPLVADSGSPP